MEESSQRQRSVPGSADLSRTMFVDTNVILRFLLNDHPDHSPRSRQLFEAAAKGNVTLWFSDTVVFETVFTLEKRLGVERDRIERLLMRLLSIAGVSYRGHVELDEVFELYINIRKLSFADCMHSVLARSSPSALILTYDREFDRVPGLVRREPPALTTDQ